MHDIACSHVVRYSCMFLVVCFIPTHNPSCHAHAHRHLTGWFHIMMACTHSHSHAYMLIVCMTILRLCLYSPYRWYAQSEGKTFSCHTPLLQFFGKAKDEQTFLREAPPCLYVGSSHLCVSYTDMHFVYICIDTHTRLIVWSSQLRKGLRSLYNQTLCFIFAVCGTLHATCVGACTR